MFALVLLSEWTGLAALPRHRVPGDVMYAPGAWQPDHDEPAAGPSASCAASRAYLALGGAGLVTLTVLPLVEMLYTCSSMPARPEDGFPRRHARCHQHDSWSVRPSAGHRRGAFELSRRSFAANGHDPGKIEAEIKRRRRCEHRTRLEYAVELLDVRKSFGKTGSSAVRSCRCGRRASGHHRPQRRRQSTLFNLISGRFGAPVARSDSTASASTADAVEINRRGWHAASRSATVHALSVFENIAARALGDGSSLCVLEVPRRPEGCQ